MNYHAVAWNWNFCFNNYNWRCNWSFCFNIIIHLAARLYAYILYIRTSLWQRSGRLHVLVQDMSVHISIYMCYSLPPLTSPSLIISVKWMGWM